MTLTETLAILNRISGNAAHVGQLMLMQQMRPEYEEQHRKNALGRAFMQIEADVKLLRAGPMASVKAAKKTKGEN